MTDVYIKCKRFASATCAQKQTSHLSKQNMYLFYIFLFFLLSFWVVFFPALSSVTSEAGETLGSQRALQEDDDLQILLFAKLQERISFSSCPLAALVEEKAPIELSGVSLKERFHTAKERRVRLRPDQREEMESPSPLPHAAMDGWRKSEEKRGRKIKVLEYSHHAWIRLCPTGRITVWTVLACLCLSYMCVRQNVKDRERKRER